MPGRLDRKTFVTTLGAAGLGLGLTAARGGPATAQAHPPTTSALGGGSRDAWLQHREQFYMDFTAALADQLSGLTEGGRQPGQSGMSGAPQAGAMHGGEGGGMPSGQGSRHGGVAGGPGSIRGGRDDLPGGGRPPGQAAGPGGGAQGNRPEGSNQGGGMPSGAETVDAAIRQALMVVLDAWRAKGRLTYGQAEAMKTLVATSSAPIAPSGLGPVLFGAAEGTLRPEPAGRAGDMPSGDLPGGGMPQGAMSGMGGGMPASQSGMHGGAMPPGQEAPGGRHGRRRR